MIVGVDEMDERNRSVTAQLVRWKRAARVFAGHWRFRAHQLLAANVVPAYRRLRRIDTPLTERYLFVLAHPRSGSTVVSHVLQTHPDIVGFGEHHESYDDLTALSKLATRNAWFDRSPRTTHRYTMDKIVWNHHGLGDDVVAHPDARFVFLVREPASTLESYRRMFADMTTDERRFESYRNRMNGLVELAERIDDPSRCAFITYEDLTDRTDGVLADLTAWLELDPPLSRDYDLNRKSGSQSWGDPSKHIGAGTIITVDREPIVIDLDVLDQANALHRTTCERLAALTTGNRATAEDPSQQPA